MQPIRSGTTLERIVRTGILALLFAGYGAMSFWDYYVRYPHENLEGMVQNLDPVPSEDDYPKINPKVTADDAEAVRQLKNGGQALTPADIESRWADPGIKQGDSTLYFGRAGVAKLQWRLSTLSQVTWIPAKRSDDSLAWQLRIGYPVSILGLLMLIQFVRVLTTRIELTDAGLKLNSQGGLRFGGSPLVPMEAMTALRDPEDGFKNKKRDWVELDYHLADGRSGTVRLNNYAHKAFPDIIDEICRRRGFENPLASEASSSSKPKPPADDAPMEAEQSPSRDADGRAG